MMGARIVQATKLRYVGWQTASSGVRHPAVTCPLRRRIVEVGQCGGCGYFRGVTSGAARFCVRCAFTTPT